MVAVKLAVLALFIVLGLTAFTADNFSPFFVEGEGADGMVTAAALIFFAYIGFDAVSTSGEEVKAPGRDLPRAIIGSLAIATALYIAVALVATGALPFDELSGAEAPLASVLDDGAGFGWGADIIALGALVAITSVVLTLLYGQSRILYAMGRDGLLPKFVARVHPRTRTPVHVIGLLGVVFALLAAFVPLTEIVELVNIGTLFAFLVVNLGVIILRRTRPELERGYRVPFVPVFPLIGAAAVRLPDDPPPGTRGWRFFIWMGIGIAIYLLYGMRKSRLRQSGESSTPTRSCPHKGFLPRRPGHARADRDRLGTDHAARDRRTVLAALAGRAVRGRGRARAVDLRPPRRPPLRVRGRPRVRHGLRGRPLLRAGLAHRRRDGRRLDRADQARRRRLVRRRRPVGRARDALHQRLGLRLRPAAGRRWRSAAPTSRPTAARRRCSASRCATPRPRPGP